MQAPIEFVRGQKWPYKVDKNDIITFCPLCNTQQSLQMNFFTGRWKCHSCNQEGTLYDLKKKIGLINPITSVSSLEPLDDYHVRKIEEAHNLLISSPSLLEELLSWRPWTIEAVKHFRLGYTEVRFEDGTIKKFLTIPHSYQGKFYNVKFRSWPGEPKEFQRIPNAPTILFNTDVCLSSETNEIMIVEGELDCITAWCCGYRNVVATTGGAKSSIPSPFLDLLEQFERVVIAFDGDEAGRVGAKKLARQLGIHRCFLIDFPDGFDLTDYVKVYSCEKLKELSPTPLYLSDIENFSAIVERISIAGGEEDLLSTGFKNLDEIVGGYAPDGFLLTIASPPKSGKTTFSCALALNFARNHGPALIYCLEMNKEKIASIIVSQLLHSSRKPSTIEASLVKENFSNLPLYHAFMANAQPEVVYETIREAFYRFGVRFVVFDNIHYLVRGVDNKASVLADVVKNFSLLTKELGITILLIAQPRKLPRQKGQPTEMTASDIAWTSALESDSDLLLIINRPRIYSKQKTFSPFFKVIAEASRYAPGGVAYFLLDEFSATVIPCSDLVSKYFTKFEQGEN